MIRVLGADTLYESLSFSHGRGRDAVEIRRLVARVIDLDQHEFLVKGQTVKGTEGYRRKSLVPVVIRHVREYTGAIAVVHQGCTFRRVGHL